ncbi:MAG: SDR family NAD(P)-dependent oxidoreductase [Nitriliruptorales bacterium]|nr:SDR family NAD(P)-dependent oxidoreductase [Nitriliruptorales bacterium]
MADPDRVVLVTGAAGAIGSALIGRFARTGARTAGSDILQQPPAGLDVGVWVPGDVTVASDMERVIADTVDRLGRIDVVVVNAGVTALGSFRGTSDEVFRRVMDVNFHGAVHTARAALPTLQASEGRLVVISSVAGFAPVVGRPAYVASKHAVTGMFESIRQELSRDGIGLTLVFPTFLTTSPADVNETDGSRTVTGRLLTAGQVADDIVRAVDRRRPRTYPGRVSKAARLLHRLVPSLYGRLMRRRLGRSNPPD